MNQDILVSIAMATYNGEEFLREQLESIYNQTYKNLEIIVTDDCSKDGTAEILEEYKQKYGLKYYINEQNSGFVKNFEKVISLCSADYIALCDQDDIWLPNKIEILMKEINNYSMICSDLTLIDSDGNVVLPSFRDNNNYSHKKMDNNKLLLSFKCFALGCCTLFKKELLNNSLPFPDYVVSHDWWLALHAYRLNGIKYLDDNLVLYRMHNNSISMNNINPPMLNKIILFFKSKTQKRKIKGLINQKKALEMSLSGEFDFTNKEMNIISQCIYYLDCYSNKTFSFKAIYFAIKNRKYLSSNFILFVLNIFSYFYIIIEKLFKG